MDSDAHMQRSVADRSQKEEKSMAHRHYLRQQQLDPFFCEGGAAPQALKCVSAASACFNAARWSQRVLLWIAVVGPSPLFGI
jgi:hypothetical protein